MIGAVFGVIGCLLAACGPLAAALGILPPTTALAVFVFGALAGLIGGILGGIGTLRGKAAAIWGLAGWVPVVIVIAAAIPAFRYPRINDISTDLESPPAFTHATTLPENAGRDMDYPDAFKAIVAASYPDVKPLELEMPAGEAFDRAVAIAKQLDHWTLTVEDKDAGRIEGIAQTALFGWKDDFVIRIEPAGGETCRIDMRSKSREGQGDLGTNAKRITGYLERVRRGPAED